MTTRTWDGEYVKTHYIITTPSGERVLCWPNAGRMVAMDGSTREWLPCADCRVQAISIRWGIDIVGKRRDIRDEAPDHDEAVDD